MPTIFDEVTREVTSDFVLEARSRAAKKRRRFHTRKTPCRERPAPVPERRRVELATEAPAAPRHRPPARSADVESPYVAEDDDELITTLPEDEHESGIRLKRRRASRAWGRRVEGTNIGGRYRARRVLATGGMGVVFECIDSVTGMPVALKVVRPDLTDDSVRRRFAREVQAARRVRSPGVAEVYDWGVDPRMGTYLAMEYVPGTTLFDHVRRDGPLSLPQAVMVIAQLSEALHRIHDAGIVHRDLKPGNVQLGRDDEGRLRVVLLDFGICRFLQDTPAGPPLTLPGTLIGTIRFMAPEQILEPHRIHHATDVWGLGAVFYYALTGRRPYEEHLEARRVCEAMLQGPPRPAHEIRPRIPHALSDLISRMMATSMAQRPTLREVHRSVRALDMTPPPREQPPSRLAEESSSAQQPPSLERLLQGEDRACEAVRRARLRENLLFALSLSSVAAAVAMAIYMLMT